MSVPQVPAVLSRLTAGLTDEPRLHDLLGRRASVHHPGDRRRSAAILVLLSDVPDVVLTERASTLRKHAGQIAFPGGAADPTDADAAGTALREAQEEVGLDPETVEVLGCLPPAFIEASLFDVSSIVGWWRAPHTLTPGDAAEVSAVHRIAVERLVDPANRVSAQHPSGYRGPAFVIDDLFVWGFSAHVLSAVLDVAGWARPWDAERTLPVPARFLRRAG